MATVLMYFAVSILSLLGVGALFKPKLRKALEDILGAASDLVHISWSYIWSFIKWNFLVYCIVTVILAVFAGWILDATSFWYYVVIPFIVPISFLFLLMRLIDSSIPDGSSLILGVSRNTARLYKAGSGVLCFSLLLVMTYGLTPHPFKRFASSLFTQTERALDEYSVGVESGHFTRITRDTLLIEKSGQVLVPSVKMGTKVMVLGTKTVRVGQSEGLLKVMLPNKLGKFIRGKIGYVPTRDVSFSDEDEEGEMKSNEKPSFTARAQYPDGRWHYFEVLEMKEVNNVLNIITKNRVGRQSIVATWNDYSKRFEGYWYANGSKRGPCYLKKSQKGFMGKTKDEKKGAPKGWFPIEFISS